MSKRNNGSDNNGNTLAAQAAFDRELMRFAQVFYRADMILDRLFENDVVVKRIAVSMPGGEREGYMGVVTADVAGVPCVAFHGGTSLGDALKGLMERLENGSIKWKTDQYRK